MKITMALILILVITSRSVAERIILDKNTKEISGQLKYVNTENHINDFSIELKFYNYINKSFFIGPKVITSYQGTKERSYTLIGIGGETGFVLSDNNKAPMPYFGTGYSVNLLNVAIDSLHFQYTENVSTIPFYFGLKIPFSYQMFTNVEFRWQMYKYMNALERDVTLLFGFSFILQPGRI